jgi:hypothetical protein
MPAEFVDAGAAPNRRRAIQFERVRNLETSNHAHGEGDQEPPSGLSASCGKNYHEPR